MPKVMIVEDDLMLADCLEEVLIDAGFDVCGIATNQADAVRLGEQHQPDLGVIDLRLSNGEYGTDIAARLHLSLDIGILYATGNPENRLLDARAGDACIGKPYQPSAIITALGIVDAVRCNRPTAAAWPKGFRLLKTGNEIQTVDRRDANLGPAGRGEA